MLSSQDFVCGASEPEWLVCRLNKQKKRGEELELLDLLDGQDEHDIILSFNWVILLS